MRTKAKATPVIPAPTPDESLGAARRRRLMMKLALVCLSVIIAAAVGEVGLMLFFRDRFVTFDDERTLLYRYDRSLGWFPIPNSKDQFLASRVITVENNSEGFRAPERVANNKPGIVFLGDSFVWGFDVDASERFTEKFQARHPEWNVFNLGVSGYGTDQEYLLLQERFEGYGPRVVFLVFCVENDHIDNSSNVIDDQYYKPYFTVKPGNLELHGVPVPLSWRSFLAQHPQLGKSYVVQLLSRAWFKISAPRPVHNPDPTDVIIYELRRYVTSRGAQLAIGLTRSDPPLEEFLRQISVPFVDLSTSLRYPKFASHWTPEGHTFVCNKIEEFLKNGQFMGTSDPGPRN